MKTDRSLQDHLLFAASDFHLFTASQARPAPGDCIARISFAGAGRPPQRPSGARRLVGLRYALAAVLSLLGLALAAPPAQAQFATGGTGAYRNNILWFRWGTGTCGATQNSCAEIGNGTLVQPAITSTQNYTVAGQTLTVTCSLSGVTNDEFRTYKSGLWTGDGLDDLYHIGNVGTANTLYNGLLNYNDSQVSTATFACSATLGGNPFPLEGLVVADAEQSRINSGVGPDESISANAPTATNWRMIDRFRTAGCANNAIANVTGTTLTLNGAATLCAAGPMGVVFMEGATSATMTLRGGGKSAMALGVMVFVADRSDAPASYGEPQHLPNFTWNGGVLQPGNNTYTTMPLATLNQPAVRLGATVDVENVSLVSAGATGDDAAAAPAIDDEDAFGAMANIALSPGAVHNLSVPCAGSGAFVRGFIDFNRDGDFADAGETSAEATCNGAAAAVSWTLPSAANLSPGASFARLRIASAASDVASPLGLAQSGEVEDYPVTLTAATLRLVKSLASRAAAADEFAAVILDGGTALAFSPSTSGATPTTASTATTTVLPGVPLTLRDAQTFGPSDISTAYTRSINCVAGPNNGAVAIPAPTGPTVADPNAEWSLTLNPGNDVVCTVTNTAAPPTLQLAKAWAAGAISGHQVTIGATTGAATNTAGFTATAPTAANSGPPVVVSNGNVITLPAEAGPNAASYSTTVACTGGHTLSGSNGQQTNTLTITSANPAVCTYTNTLLPADLAITKSNTYTPAQPSDLAGDSVSAGASTTYTLVVTNNGPGAVTGAVVRDTPGAGLVCPPGDAVTISGNGVPAGSFTIADLTGAAGIALGTLSAGQSTVLVFTCNVP